MYSDYSDEVKYKYWDISTFSWLSQILSKSIYYITPIWLT